MCNRATGHRKGCVPSNSLSNNKFFQRHCIRGVLSYRSAFHGHSHIVLLGPRSMPRLFFLVSCRCYCWSLCSSWSALDILDLFMLSAQWVANCIFELERPLCISPGLRLAMAALSLVLQHVINQKLSFLDCVFPGFFVIIFLFISQPPGGISDLPVNGTFAKYRSDIYFL